ncbi:hypothetical protein RFI_20266 [Reticulomyxa filosa]|uniref:Uncharacterized protein n=1 Tax=Reticulomyxa filosa TaxID=46433 RepID=X6MVD7_RETFI|nr:hypothetical protein RFI_20266 [Reticulomyxa filosa]|eukprot:ETO17070.1 hypothetical protein RFI_20266 [Reticulomyxa filosa]
MVGWKHFKFKKQVTFENEKKLPDWQLKQERTLLTYNRYLISNLNAFVISFIVVHVFPAIDRLYGFVNHSSSAPFGIVALHDWCMASVGIGDGLVWFFMSWNRRQFHRIENFHPLVFASNQAFSMGENVPGTLESQDAGNGNVRNQNPDAENTAVQEDHWIERLPIFDSNLSINSSSQQTEPFHYPVSYERMITTASPQSPKPNSKSSSTFSSKS